MNRHFLLVLVLLSSVLAFSQSPRTKVSAPSFDQLAHNAQQARDANRDDDAMQLYQQALKLKPDWDEGLWYLGVFFYEKERFSECRDELRHFLAQNPAHAPGWAILGLSEYQTHEYARALTHLERSLSLGLSEREHLANTVYYHKAALLNRLEQFQDGLMIALSLSERGVPRESLQELAGLAALGYPFLPEEIPADRRPLVKLAGEATFALLSQKLPETEAATRKMVEGYPNEPGVHYRYGLLLFAQDHAAEAVEEMRKEVAITPSHTGARLRIAEYLLNQSQPDQARPYIDDVLKIEPRNATGHLLLGEALGSTGDKEGAVRELEIAKQLAPGTPKVLWALLRAYTAVGRIEDAKRVKEEIAKTNKPDSPQ